MCLSQKLVHVEFLRLELDLQLLSRKTVAVPHTSRIEQLQRQKMKMKWLRTTWHMKTLLQCYFFVQFFFFVVVVEAVPWSKEFTLKMLDKNWNWAGKQCQCVKHAGETRLPLCKWVMWVIFRLFSWEFHTQPRKVIHEDRLGIVFMLL